MRGNNVLLIGQAPNIGPDFGRQFEGVIARAHARAHRDGRLLPALLTENRIADTARRFDAIERETRGDSFSASAGLHMARQLEHIYAEVLREPFPLLNAWTLFPLDLTVPPGARTHTVRRVYQDGEAAVYRGGQSPIPRVGVSQQEEQFPVRHYVTSFVYSLFEQLSSQFANTALVSELLRTARDVLMEFANDKTWNGDSTNGIYGVLNYPWLPKKVVATAFDGSAAADDVLAELNDLANFPQEQSRSTFKPDTLVVSPRVRNFLMNTPRSATTDTTIGEFWLRTNSLGIKSIEEAWELQGVGPSSTDGVLFYRRDRLGIANVLPQPFTTLPVQSMGFEDTTFAYMSHGGVIMRDVGNNILGWVDAA